MRGHRPRRSGRWLRPLRPPVRYRSPVATPFLYGPPYARRKDLTMYPYLAYNYWDDPIIEDYNPFDDDEPYLDPESELDEVFSDLQEEFGSMDIEPLALARTIELDREIAALRDLADDEQIELKEGALVSTGYGEDEKRPPFPILSKLFSRKPKASKPSPAPQVQIREVQKFTKGEMAVTAGVAVATFGLGVFLGHRLGRR